MNFYPQPFEVGNLSTIGMIENELEEKIWDMIEDLKYRYGLYVPSYIVTDEMHARNIPYELLPQHLKDIIDEELDVY